VSRFFLWTVALALVGGSIRQEVRASRSARPEIGLSFSTEAPALLITSDRPEAVIQPFAAKRVAPDVGEAAVEDARRKPEPRRGAAEVAASVAAVPETAAPSRGRAPPAAR
jgi:hypothetical protein